MDEKKLVPKRRFKSFKNEWVERCLRDLSEYFTYGLNAESREYDGENKYLRITDIDDATRRVDKNDLTSPHIDYEVSSDYILSEGDILFARTGASVGKTYRYDSIDGKVYYAGFLIKTRIKNEHDTEFVFQNTLTKRYKSFVYITSQRSGQPGINAQEYSTFTIFVPTIEEQQKTGQFFKILDERIANQERKIAKVKALKAAYLTEMFPQEGETVPKRRFKGFKEKWLKKEVGKIFQITRGNVLSTTKIKKKKSKIACYPVYSSQTQNNGLLGYYSDFLFDTAITWTTDGANAGTVKYREGKFYSTNVNGVLVSNDGYTCKAIAELLNLEAWKHVSKVGNPKLMSNVMSNIEILIPENTEELDRLSIFFKNLDNQIETEEKKLDKLQKMKEAYLEEMFV